MLFNSYTFIFLFLPFVFSILLLTARCNTISVLWMVAASLFFYGWWKISALPILIGSTLFNYTASRLILACSNRRSSQLVLGLAIATDLVLLGYFKYAGFFSATFCAVLEISCARIDILLPIGISFFTFTQIAYLVDAHRGKVTDSNFFRYCLFVTYFPHLIAGPILHHSEMIPQFKAFYRRRITGENIAVGLTVFVAGLFKKVCLADSVAVLVPPVFDAAGGSFSAADAWVSVIAYTVQIYFDFSAYSDMALGMSYMFGIRLPINFNSPYQAVDIIAFWRRWHMTLSAFLRDYLYIPLGGNRLGWRRRYVNLLATMLLGGLWHGAAWTFVIWGALHGLYLIINHGWRRLRQHTGMAEIPALASWGLTLTSVTVAWVFFRAPSLDSALMILGRMFGLSMGAESGLASVQNGFLLAALMAIALLCPNLQQIIPTPYYLGEIERGMWRWSPSVPWAVAVSVLAIMSVVYISRQSVFLYFQF